VAEPAQVHRARMRYCGEAAYRRLPRERVPQAATTLSAIVQVGGSFGTAVLALALTAVALLPALFLLRQQLKEAGGGPGDAAPSPASPAAVA
jgi:hypothetical protein